MLRRQSCIQELERKLYLRKLVSFNPFLLLNRLHMKQEERFFFSQYVFTDISCYIFSNTWSKYMFVLANILLSDAV